MVGFLFCLSNTIHYCNTFEFYAKFNTCFGFRCGVLRSATYTVRGGVGDTVYTHNCNYMYVNVFLRSVSVCE